MYDKDFAIKEFEKIEAVIENGPYNDTWESLINYKTPEWFKDAKFGIFIHWGVFTVPEWGSEWYPRLMYIKDSEYYEHHIKTYGLHKDFGYKDFIPMFKAEKFDPMEWVKLFKEAGAKYIVPVGEHHDGFQMYESKLSKWNAFDMGPKRDILGELKKAADSEGLYMGTSSHRIEHRFFFGHGKEFESDVKENCGRDDLYWPAVELKDDNYFDPCAEPYPSEEFLQDWLLRTCEMIDRFKPRVLYFDWWIQHIAARPYVRKAAAYYYNRAHEWGIDAALIYKYDTFAFGSAIYDVERGQMKTAQPYYWQSDTSCALNSWCYTVNNQYRSAESIVQTLADIVSKNGNLLLNVGPRANGEVCEEEKSILRSVGKWLSSNGEAIYGSRPWRVYGEGPTQINDGGFSEKAEYDFTPQDIRYLVNGQYLYAIVLCPSKDGKYHLKELGGEHKDPKVNGRFHGVVDSIELMGFPDSRIRYGFDDSALNIYSEKAKIDNTKMPIVFRIKLK